MRGGEIRNIVAQRGQHRAEPLARFLEALVRLAQGGRASLHRVRRLK